MGLFLAELSRAVPARTHAVLVLDRAGWHVSADLVVPANLTLVHLPPYRPELNPVETVWRLYLRERWPSHRASSRGRLRGGRGRRRRGQGAERWETAKFPKAHRMWAGQPTSRCVSARPRQHAQMLTRRRRGRCPLDIRLGLADFESAAPYISEDLPTSSS